jgi:hypothetical protein
VVEHPPDHLSTEDYRARAQARAADSPVGVGAAVERTVWNAPGRPGRTWECVVTDPDGREFHFFEVWSPDIGEFAGVAPETVAAAVEAAAVEHGGLAQLLEHGLLEVAARDLGVG